MVVKKTWFRVILLGIVPVAVAGAFWPAGQIPPSAAKAKEILAKKCGGCHNSGFIFDPKSHRSVLQSKVVVAGDLTKSILYQRIVKGEMPPTGKLPPDEIQSISEWITSGAPNWNPTPATALGSSVQPSQTAPAAQPQDPPAPQPIAASEPQVLKAILSDLESSPESRRPFLRYFSTANLLRNPESSEDAQKYAGALSKLVNSLSWAADIASLPRLGPSNSVFRLDLRDVDWTTGTWKLLTDAYPYGYVARDTRGLQDQIRTLNGASLPYLRVDWFCANASVAPLYHAILELPRTVRELETKLDVDVERNQRENKVIRAGLTQSNISVSNRAVERHATKYGAYWRSFDFAGNLGRQNIFAHPLDFQEDGGEYIFNLPNGLQAYYISNSKGQRLDRAPAKIVRDRSAIFGNVEVFNALNCISCHSRGMQQFASSLRQTLETQQSAAFDLDKALEWYVTQSVLKESFKKDTDRFGRAVEATGNAFPRDENGEPQVSPSEEPVTQIVVRYLRDSVSLDAAASEICLPVSEFKRRIEKSSVLESRGFGQFLGAEGGMKRDSWEQSFGVMVSEIRVGEPTGAAAKRAEEPEDPRTPVQFLTEGSDTLVSRAKSQIFLRLGQSFDLRPTTSHAETRVKIASRTSDESLDLIAIVRGQELKATGSRESVLELADNLADRIQLLLAGTKAGPLPASQPTNQAERIALGSVRELLDAAVNSTGYNTAINVDRGPGSTYRIGDVISVTAHVDRPAFVAIYDVDSLGVVSLLFPNKFNRNNHVRDVRFLIPDPNEAWVLRASGTPGRERMFLLAADDATKLPGLAGFLANPSGEFVSKSVGVFSKEIGTLSSQGSGQIGASLVDFFTADR